SRLDASVLDPSIINGGGNGDEARSMSGRTEVTSPADKEKLAEEARMIALRHWLAEGENGMNRLSEEQRAMSASDFAGGGVITAPKLWIGKLIEAARDVSIFLNEVNVLPTIDKAESLGVHKITSRLGRYKKLGENEAPQRAEMSF